MATEILYAYKEGYSKWTNILMKKKKSKGRNACIHWQEKKNRMHVVSGGDHSAFFHWWESSWRNKIWKLASLKRFLGELTWNECPERKYFNRRGLEQRLRDEKKWSLKWIWRNSPGRTRSWWKTKMGGTRQSWELKDAGRYSFVGLRVGLPQVEHPQA